MNIEDIEVGKKYWVKPWQLMDDVRQDVVHEITDTRVIVGDLVWFRLLTADQVIAPVDAPVVKVSAPRSLFNLLGWGTPRKSDS